MTKQKKALIMGILNVTPDSCYDGGRYFEESHAIERALQIAKEGGDWIDIGGESTRPGAAPVTLEEELKRVVPVIKKVREAVDLPLSIDTYKPEVAEAALKLGVSMINDISGLSDEKMVAVARDFKASVCVMHMQGTPKSMQTSPNYPKGVVVELLEWFQRKIEGLLASGLAPSQIYLDPGLGFGKTLAHNFEILQNLDVFQRLGFPLVLGHSRKSFMTHFLNEQNAYSPYKREDYTRDDLLPASLAVAAWAVLKGVEILRVHDVSSHRDTAQIWARLLENSATY